MQLLRFVCTFAWADLHVTDQERMLVARIADRMKLDPIDTSQVAEWLAFPPQEGVDPTEVPLEHRRLFLESALEMMAVDGDVDPAELEHYAIFEALVPSA